MLEILPAINEWGQHLVLDLGDCDLDAIKCGETIRQFNDELVAAIDMVAYGEPRIVNFANHDPKKGGYTLDQLIETSNIMGHFAENIGQAFMDVFSCKPFDDNIVINLCRKYFKAKKWRPIHLLRGDWSGDVFYEIEPAFVSMSAA